MGTARYGPGGAGNQTAALAFGGFLTQETQQHLSLRMEVLGQVLIVWLQEQDFRVVVAHKLQL